MVATSPAACAVRDTIVPSILSRAHAVIALMDTRVDALPDHGQRISAATTELIKWYAAHSIVRHLWAIETGEALRIVVTLEPTLDGDDTQPAWLANSWTWVQELRFRLQRRVHLELLNEPSARLAASCDSASALLTEISWRDPSSAAS